MKDFRKHFSVPAFLLAVFFILFLVFLFSGEAFTLQQGQGKKTPKAPAPVPRTGQTISYAPGDDGDLQAGVEWPDPRFVDNGDGTVTDRLTMLMWTQDTEFFIGYTWAAGIQACNDLVFAGYDDWRMPNVFEIVSLFDHSTYSLPAGHPFVGLGTTTWTSTTFPREPDHAWALMSPLEYDAILKDTAIVSAWPVRSVVPGKK